MGYRWFDETNKKAKLIKKKKKIKVNGKSKVNQNLKKNEKESSEIEGKRDLGGN